MRRSGTRNWKVRLRRLGGRGSVRGSPCDEPARLRTGLQGSIPPDPGIRVQLRRLGGRGFVRGSPCGESARLRFTSLRPPSCGGSAGPSRCTASSGTEPWRPASLCPRFSYCGVPQGAQYIREWGAPPPAAAPPLRAPTSVTRDTSDTSHRGIFAAYGTAGKSHCEVQALSRDIPGGCRYCGWRSVPRPQPTSQLYCPRYDAFIRGSWSNSLEGPERAIFPVSRT